ncbi:MAG: hypothetical protein V4574_19075 [Pseudomonadota bacterium]
MRLLPALILTAFAAGGCARADAQTRPAPIVPVAEAPRDCPLVVSFGSYAMGIDGSAFAKVSALLARDRGVRTIEQHRWGREGEVTLCARTRGKADARRLYRAVRAVLPAKPRGPVTVEAGQARFTAPRG